MSDLWTFDRANASAMPNMASWQVTNSQSEGYLIQASWPLGWSDVSDTQTISKPANVVYTVDGNAMFMSATDVVRRRQSATVGQIATIVIAISYLITDSNYTAPPFAGSTQPPAYGGADALLDFITKDVNSFIFSSVFPHVSVNQSALFGHSYGGLFTLHTLYTAPESFDVYLAASPSIWWNDRYILQEEKKFHQKSTLKHRPDVWMSYGTLEQHPEHLKGETDEAFQKRVSDAEYLRMADNVEEMYRRLEKTSLIKSVKKRVYQDEDHPSVIGGALSGALYYFMGI
ncbi:esterase [Penicillium capsulatum]|uniref:Esterase n=1 Tax=Penicillium capsulatum TaxID=69766 RepID=A0A9W9IQD0_9EURO|nr:esterase [Penicillium capsulatum]KAJ6130527.1 esterase [Penicillium capsulatum]